MFTNEQKAFKKYLFNLSNNILFIVVRKVERTKNHLGPMQIDMVLGLVRLRETVAGGKDILRGNHRTATQEVMGSAILVHLNLDMGHPGKLVRNRIVTTHNSGPRHRADAAFKGQNSAQA